MSHSRTELSTGWSLRQHDLEDVPANWLPVDSVPSQVHVDLLANNKIADPFVDLNEQAVQWVGEKTWVYKTAFAVGPSSTTSPLTTDLVFEGLDTFATVTLNGKEILRADNMFVAYRVHVTDLVAETNELEIVFESALIRGRELVSQHSHEHAFYVRQTENSRVPVRKAQYHWGWDWGPLLMTAGPWKPIVLERYVARLDDLWAQNELSPDLNKVSGTLSVRVSGPTTSSTPAADGGEHAVLFSLATGGRTVLEAQAAIGDNGLASVPFTLDNPELWWPFGYGDQTRYSLHARLVRRPSTSAAAAAQETSDSAALPKATTTLSQQTRLIGFRRTELIQTPDAHGKSFYFRINNTDVFCGGSCWIPGDSFLTTITPERYQDWVALCVESGQVMLRVWGGGVYEHDALVDACDELGVLVWHDFQFACASYPTYPSYLRSFEVEARQQVRRLRTHPSVVIWAGNNEDYMVQERYGLQYDFDDKDPEAMLKSTFPARYIYEHWLPRMLDDEDPHVIYHPSSPWGDGKPWADETVGDMHQWHIWHGNVNRYQEVNILGGRFISEFGMEAYPHLATLRGAITDPAQRYPGSILMDTHNKAAGHQRRLATYVTENFRHPAIRSSSPGPEDELALYTHLTQVTQAETMRYAYKFWRRGWGTPGDRKIGGVLVWQLNDCWPTVSWAVVDYHLVRKPGFYAIARALRPLDVGVARTVHDWTQTTDLVDELSKLRTGQVNHTLPARGGVAGATFDVWVASSRTDAVKLVVTTRFVSVRSGRDIQPSTTQTLTAAANATTTVTSAHPCPPAIPHADDPNVPFSISAYDPYVIHASVSLDGATTLASDASWPEPIKYLDFPDRGIRLDVSPTGDVLTVSADKPVKGFVLEEMVGLKLSDNGFDIIPGEKHRIKVQGVLRAGELRYTYIGAPSPSIAVS